jgi:hypothetical protein
MVCQGSVPFLWISSSATQLFYAWQVMWLSQKCKACVRWTKEHLDKYWSEYESIETLVGQFVRVSAGIAEVACCDASPDSSAAFKLA